MILLSPLPAELALYDDRVPTADRPPPEARNRLGPRPSIPGQRLLGPALVILLWFVGSGIGLINPAKLSPPGTVAATFVDLLRSGDLQANLLVSLQRAGLGLAFGAGGGLVLALLAGLTRLGDALIDGLAQIKRAIPNLALLPIAIIWVGIGEEMKVLIIALGVAIPIYINTHSALRGIDRRYVELAETVRLSHRQFLRHIALPSALPGFFIGLRLAIAHAWTALVVVETVNATSGIGYMMTQARIYGQTEVVLVGLVVYGLLGLVSDALVRTVERKVLSWRQTLAA